MYKQVEPHTLFILWSNAETHKQAQAYAKTLQSTLTDNGVNTVMSDPLNLGALFNGEATAESLRTFLTVSSAADDMARSVLASLSSYPSRVEAMIYTPFDANPSKLLFLVQSLRHLQFKIVVLDLNDGFTPIFRKSKEGQEILSSASILGSNESSQFIGSKDLNFERIQARKRLFRVTPPDSLPWVVAGDIHETPEALDYVFERFKGFRPRLVINGDWMDKGSGPARMLEWMETNFKDDDELILGNHESYIYGRLSGDILDSKADHLFPAYGILKDSKELRDSFLKFVRRSKPFLVFSSTEARPEVFISHSPVLPKFMSKVDPFSMKMQRNMPLYGLTEDSVQEAVAGMAKAIRNPQGLVRIHGHVTHKGFPNIGCGVYMLDNGVNVGGPVTYAYLDSNMVTAYQLDSVVEKTKEITLDLKLSRPAKIQA